jgi:hypothetical protein
MVGLNDAAASVGVTTRTICFVIANNIVHFSEATDGALLICEESLTRHFLGDI